MNTETSWDAVPLLIVGPTGANSAAARNSVHDQALPLLIVGPTGVNPAAARNSVHDQTLAGKHLNPEP